MPEVIQDLQERKPQQGDVQFHSILLRWSFKQVFGALQPKKANPRFHETSQLQSQTAKKVPLQTTIWIIGQTAPPSFRLLQGWTRSYFAIVLSLSGVGRCKRLNHVSMVSGAQSELLNCRPSRTYKYEGTPGPLGSPKPVLGVQEWEEVSLKVFSGFPSFPEVS